MRTYRYKQSVLNGNRTSHTDTGTTEYIARIATKREKVEEMMVVKKEEPKGAHVLAVGYVICKAFTPRSLLTTFNPLRFPHKHAAQSLSSCVSV